ncbi:MAG: hypothetical protein ACYC05_13780 [Sulfuricella sp.]
MLQQAGTIAFYTLLEALRNRLMWSERPKNWKPGKKAISPGWRIKMI